VTVDMLALTTGIWREMLRENLVEVSTSFRDLTRDRRGSRRTSSKVSPFFISFVMA